MQRVAVLGRQALSKAAHTRAADLAPVIADIRAQGITSANGIAFVRDNLCFPVAAGSFEEGMGA